LKPIYAKSFVVIVATAVAVLAGGGSAAGAASDVSVSITDGVTSAVPGTGLTYTITVSNIGGSNVKGASVNDTFPLTGVTWSCAPGLGAACTGSGAGDIHQSVNLASGSSAVFTATGTIPPSAFPSLSDTATIALAKGGQPDPTPGNNTATDTDAMTPVADLSLDSVNVGPSVVFGNSVASQNTLLYSVSFHNNGGPSDAHDATLSFNPVLNTLIGSAEWCVVTPAVTCTSDGQFTAYNGQGMDVGEVAPGAVVNMAIRAHASALDRNGVLSVTQPFQLSMPAPSTDPVSTNNSATAPQASIDTVPSPVQNLQLVAGNGNVIVTWEPPANDGGQPVTGYTVTTTPSVTGSPFSVPVNAPQVTCPNGTDNCYSLNITTVNNDTPYAFDVQAQNAVGSSDAVERDATPSKNASSRIVSSSTTTIFSTCTTATSAQPTCVQIAVPAGPGGVFGSLGGTVVTLPSGFCGLMSQCNPNTAAENIGALTGYNDPTQPLVETITWDSSTLPSDVPTNPVCSTNSTATNCFPNDLPSFYEMEAVLPSDPTGALSTQLNLPGTFCADPVKADGTGGAGNPLFARPLPTTGGQAMFNGYATSAGSACIRKMSVLTGQPGGRPNQKGDVQEIINFTSDSDALQGHR
jgi:uncharacterized repeat protein (TIGR01451 family)